MGQKWPMVAGCLGVLAFAFGATHRDLTADPLAPLRHKAYAHQVQVVGSSMSGWWRTEALWVAKTTVQETAGDLHASLARAGFNHSYSDSLGSNFTRDRNDSLDIRSFKNGVCVAYRRDATKIEILLSELREMLE